MKSQDTPRFNDYSPGLSPPSTRIDLKYTKPIAYDVEGLDLPKKLKVKQTGTEPSPSTVRKRNARNRLLEAGGERFEVELDKSQKRMKNAIMKAHKLKHKKDLLVMLIEEEYARVKK